MRPLVRVLARYVCHRRSFFVAPPIVYAHSVRTLSAAALQYQNQLIEGDGGKKLVQRERLKNSCHRSAPRALMKINWKLEVIVIVGPVAEQPACCYLSFFSRAGSATDLNVARNKFPTLSHHTVLTAPQRDYCSRQLSQPPTLQQHANPASTPLNESGCHAHSGRASKIKQ